MGQPALKQPKLQKDKLYFLPLGGCGHFGANLNLYHLDGQWLAIDCGMGFADERFPGVDILLPDPSFIEERADKLAGLIITHAHEDHIGGVANLWPRLKCPVYATPFTMEVLKRKLSEVPHGRDVPLREVENQGRAQIGPFDVEWINMAHSIPDTSSLFLRTKAGNILHSGDWNFDPKPAAGFKSDEKRLKELGQEGVLAYVGDSTNSLVTGTSGSEDDLVPDFMRLFSEVKGKIAVTLFSSNIGRLKTVIKSAKASERSICLVGRSLKNMADIALKFDLIKDDGIFVSEDEAAYFPADRIAYVMTGSQGEGRAQLPKVARGEHPTVTLGEGDTVLFSARAIPGNERAIIDMRNALIGLGVEVITTKEAHIHVSGHPARDEIAHMFQLTRPNAVIPVHGEVEQQEAHAALAKECQVAHAYVPGNGEVIHIDKDGLHPVGAVQAELLAYDEARIVPLDHPAIKERRRISFHGVGLATIVANPRKECIEDLQLSTMGLIDEASKRDMARMDELLDMVADQLAKLPAEKWEDEDALGEEARLCIRRYFRDWLKVKPTIIVHVVLV